MTIKKTIYVNANGILTLTATDTNGFQLTGVPLSFKRGDTATLNVIFLDAAGAPTTLANGTILTMAVKPMNQYDSQELYVQSELVVNNQAATAYDLNFTLNSIALHDALKVNEPLDVDVPSVTGMLELTWTSDGGVTFRSTQNVAAFLVNNDVIRGDETIPNALTLSPDTFLGDRAVRYDQAQSLTVAEQQRARDNIGVDGTVEVAKSLHTTVRAEVAVQKGQAVYISGASGSNKKVRLAKADAEATSSKTIGLSSEALAVNGLGDIVTEGSLSGLSIDVSALTVAEGDPVWLSPTTAGGLLFGAANKPAAPNHMVLLGIVTRITGNTLTDIFVKVQNGFELQELHNVQITSPTTGQALLYDAVNGLWKNQAISSELQELQDVQITSPATGETLVYDAVTGLWKNQSSGIGGALAVAGGAMDTGAAITLDTPPDGNGFSADSEVGGWGFGVQQKENGTNTGLSSYIDPTGFYAASDPEYVTATATGMADGEVLRKVLDFNFKPSYEGDVRLRYSGDRWYLDDYSVGEVLASVGDESYPWQASWPSGTVITPSTNQTTHLSGAELIFSNGSKLKKGTTIADGNGGIALKCSVDYELKWEAGRLYTMEQNGFTIRRVDHCRNIAPTATDDSAKGFVVGSMWTLDDGTSYECTNALESSATWVATQPLTLGDGLVFTGSTNTLNTSTNVARRAGAQVFSGNNTFGASGNSVETVFFGTQTFNGSRTFAGTSSFSGQVELTGQAATNSTSALTRALGDARYGVAGAIGNIYSSVKVDQVVSADNTPVTLASVTLPVGTYQVDSLIAAFASASGHGGYLFTLRASANVHFGLLEIYAGDASTLSPGNPISNESTTFTSRSVTTSSVLSQRRQLTGIVEVLTANTVLSIEFSQAALITQPAAPAAPITLTTRKRAHLIARKIA